VPGPNEIEIPLCPHFGRPLYEIHNGALRPITAGFSETPKDLDGRNIHIYTANLYNFVVWEDIDATPNETLDIIRRMNEIAEDYNCTFSFEQTPRAAAAVERLRDNRLVGDKEVDIFNINIFHTQPENIFQENVVMDLRHPAVSDIIDFDNQPWHFGSAMSHLWGTQYGVHFATANSGEILSSVLTFNKDFMERYSLGNFFEMVHNMTWTFDNFERILRLTLTNSNDTVIPLVCHREQFIGPGFIFANGGSLINNTPDGLVYVGDTNDNALEAITFLQRLRADNLLVFWDGNVPGEGVTVLEILERTANGEALMMSGEYDLLRTLNRGRPFPSEYSFGLLPTPRGEHMDDYVAAMIRFDMFYIVNDVAYPEEVAAILVAMANRLTKLNIVETELLFGLGDMESAAIFEMMLDRMVIDWSRITGTRGAITSAIFDTIRGSNTAVQRMTSIANDVNTRISRAQTRPATLG
jgi:hypothetical protein